MATTVQRAAIGVEDFVYTLLTDGTDTATTAPSYGTIYSIPGLKTANYASASGLTRLYGDNGVFAASEYVGDQSLSIEVADIPPQDRQRLFGFGLANGIETRSSDSISPYVAVGFKVTLDGGHSSYVWIPKIKFNKPSQNAQTKESNTTYQTQSVEGAILNLIYNSNYMITARTDDTAVSATTLSNWFLQPVISSSADLGALSVVATKVSTDMVFTVTKAGGGNVTIAQADCTTEKLPVYKTGASQSPIAGTYVITNNGTATVTITFTPTVAFGTALVCGSVTTQFKDQNGVAATQKGAVISYP